MSWQRHKSQRCFKQQHMQLWNAQGGCYSEKEGGKKNFLTLVRPTCFSREYLTASTMQKMSIWNGIGLHMIVESNIFSLRWVNQVYCKGYRTSSATTFISSIIFILLKTDWSPLSYSIMILKASQTFFLHWQYIRQESFKRFCRVISFIYRHNLIMSLCGSTLFARCNRSSSIV